MITDGGTVATAAELGTMRMRMLASAIPPAVVVNGAGLLGSSVSKERSGEKRRLHDWDCLTALLLTASSRASRSHRSG